MSGSAAQMEEQEQLDAQLNTISQVSRIDVPWPGVHLVSSCLPCVPDPDMLKIS